uniref:Uncharacterized protein LOC108053757 n=1 Tax=Drosophila rhopaloa TaxID=1041015 RepID=A0A6P4FN29_DRORH
MPTTTIIHRNFRRIIRIIRPNHIRRHPHPHPRRQQRAAIRQRRDMAARITPSPCTTPNGPVTIHVQELPTTAEIRILSNWDLGQDSIRQYQRPSHLLRRH